MIIRTAPFVVGLCALGTVHCGVSKALSRHKGGGGATSSADASSNVGALIPGAGITLELVANYTPRPVDVIIIRDGDSHNFTIDSRLKASLPLLTARLWNLSGTVGGVHVGVFDHFFEGQNQDPNKPTLRTATPIVDDVRSDAILRAETFSVQDFNASIADRLAEAGTRGGDTRPASVLKAVLEESKKPGGGDVGELLRENAFWSVLYIGARLNPHDPVDASDLTAMLADHKAGFQISALTIDKDGCDFADVKTPQKANPKGEPQRNLELKLQTITKGVFGSVCNATYGLFMDDYVKAGTGSQYFQVELPAPVQAASIDLVGSAGESIKDFRYVPGSKSIDVTTLVGSGDSFKLTAVLDTPPPTPVVESDPGDLSVPQATQK